VSDKTIRSGQDIVKEFIHALSANPDLDKDTIDVIVHLYSEGKLSQVKLQQALNLKRNK
jgi:hypothetical protein